MQEYLYKEGVESRFFGILLFLFGVVFQLWFLFDTLPGYIRNDPNVNPDGMLYALMFLLVWDLASLYFIFNTPKALVLTNKGLKVIWGLHKQKIYSWQNVKITTIGLNTTPVIIIVDNNWLIPNFGMPRLLMLNGWTKRYKNLVAQIKRYV